MYILVHEDVDMGHALLACAHASLGGYLTFVSDEMLTQHPEEWVEKAVAETRRWATESFRKVICRVNSEQFDQALGVAGDHKLMHRVMTEMALPGQEIAIVFAPREDWPKFFQYLPLYREHKAAEELHKGIREAIDCLSSTDGNMLRELTGEE
jgi:peptidyl-tRNA hydrolase